jgi:hypothetical protein
LLLLSGDLKKAEYDRREMLRLARKKETKRAVAFLKPHILDAKRNLLLAIERQRAND